MPALIQPEILKRAVNDPQTAAQLVQLIARKSKSKVGKKIKPGTIAGIIIAIIIIVIIIAIIYFLYQRNQKKKLQGGH